MIHDLMPGTEEFLNQSSRSAYVGIDPTADSLHIGHLVSVMIMRHFQRCGHKPILLIGGATGMIGDPSGKSDERNLLTPGQIEQNIAGIRAQLERLIDFSPENPNAALLVNNYDWMKGYSFLEFIRDVGKHITVNYMMAKDSVKRRLDPESGAQGLSFTEFSYQLLQAYDFLVLYREKHCALQLGGSDQWGNITTGVELIRRIEGAQAFGLTCPLITKADGTKFGKTEQGNIWLAPARTPPYRFYQFWLNTSDEDAERFIRIYTLHDEPTILALEAQHREAPHQRLLQRELAEQVTSMVHGEEALKNAIEASQILFGKDTHAALMALDEQTLLEILEGVPTYEVPKEIVNAPVPAVTLFTEQAPVFPSKGDFRRNVTNGAVSVNKERINDPDYPVGKAHAIGGRYILVQKGKKEYHLIRLV